MDSGILGLVDSDKPRCFAAENFSAAWKIVRVIERWTVKDRSGESE